MRQYALFAISCLLNLFIYGQSELDQLLDKGYLELESGSFHAAKFHLEKAEKILSQKANIYEKAILLNNLGVCHSELGNFKKGIDSYTASLNLYRKIGNDTLIGESLLNLGIAYKDIGAFDKATKTILSAAWIFEKNKARKELSSAWNSIGNIQREIGNFEKALDYHLRALRIRKEINYQKGIADSYNNIGSIYLDQHKPEIAKNYLEDALNLKRDLGNEWNSLTTLTLLGRSYLELNQAEKAYSYLNEAYNVRLHTGNNSKIASSLYYLGTYYSKTNDFKKALALYEQSEELAGNLSDYALLKDILTAEIKLIHANKAYKTLVIDKYEKLVSVDEKLVSEENRKEIARLEIGYDVERKEKEIRLRRKQARLNRMELENQRLYNQQLIGWLIFAVLITVSTILGWYLLRKRKKIIEEQNLELKEQKEEIINLHHELSHRTKNYFSMLSGMLKSDKLHANHPETNRVLEENIRRLDAMSLIQHYLLDESAHENKEVRLDSYLNHLTDLLLINLSPHNRLKINKEFSQIYLGYDSAMHLAIVLNELVCNAIEHGLNNNPHPELSIQLKQKHQRIHLLVKDNGKGIPDQYTVKTNSKGLILIRKLLHKMEGSIDFKNDNGCVVHVTIKS